MEQRLPRTFSLCGAVTVEVLGGGLIADAPHVFGFGSGAPVNDGERFLVGRVRVVQGQSVVELVGIGTGMVVALEGGGADHRIAVQQW